MADEISQNATEVVKTTTNFCCSQSGNGRQNDISFSMFLQYSGNHRCRNLSGRKCQDYFYVKWEYESTMENQSDIWDVKTK